uniref:Putative dual specificity protein phosphatase DSP8 n=1 Tax=Rhizophora mucronata TaxID=61149 RepID=A0A2P2ME59_RHIMU
MIIEELNAGGEVEKGEEKKSCVVVGGDKKRDSEGIVAWYAKRVLIGVGARALFYPTLLYNVVRNKFQAEFRWWDWVDKV